jgi:hypothetical protein
VGRGEVQAPRGLVDHRPELAQRLHVEVDRARPDVAAAQVRNDGVAEPVQQRAAEQDRDAAGAGVHVDLVDVGALDVGRVEDQLTVDGAVAHPYAVQLQQAADDLDVADTGHIEQPARRLAEQGRDHGLGDQVLGAADADRAVQRSSAVHREDVRHVPSREWMIHFADNRPGSIALRDGSRPDQAAPDARITELGHKPLYLDDAE